MKGTERLAGSASRRGLFVAVVCLVAVLGLSLVWIQRPATPSNAGTAGATTVSSETTINTTPQTLTSIPYCRQTSTQLAEANPQPTDNPDRAFWANQEEAIAAGLSVEAEYGETPEWAGFYLDGPRLVVFRFTDRQSDRDANIAALVGAWPHLVVQVDFSDVEREAADLRLREALTAAGGTIESGMEAFGVSGWGSAGLSQYVEIDLFDHDQIETWPQRVALEPPYDIYCFNTLVVRNDDL